MVHRSKNSLMDNLNIIWTIASKDIVDALRNRLIIGMIFSLSIILLIPRMLPLIFEQPQMTIVVFVSGKPAILSDFENNQELEILLLNSEQDFTAALCRAMFPQIGLRIPADFDQTIVSAAPYEFQGFSCWNKRYAVLDLETELDETLTKALSHPVDIHLAGNFVYPNTAGVFTMSLATINAVLMVLMIGISLIPSLLFEEKESKTIQALLVSPASIGQVVLAKALAGAFYILVTAMMIFTISWADVVHWDLIIIFVLCGGLFSVALGLLLGSFFDKQQDMIGWMMLLLILLVGTILVMVFAIELPTWVSSLLPWIPSVALAEICRAAFSETFTRSDVLANLGIVLAICLPLYALVIWKVRRSDR